MPNCMLCFPISETSVYKFPYTLQVVLRFNFFSFRYITAPPSRHNPQKQVEGHLWVEKIPFSIIFVYHPPPLHSNQHQPVAPSSPQSLTVVLSHSTNNDEYIRTPPHIITHIYLNCMNARKLEHNMLHIYERNYIFSNGLSHEFCYTGVPTYFTTLSSRLCAALYT